MNSLSAQEEIVKLGIIGLSHDHVNWIFEKDYSQHFEVVGFVEANENLIIEFYEKYKIPKAKFFNSIQDLITSNKPDGVFAFGNIYDHLKIVENCAPFGIHVMVEKPLAVNLEHAQKMKHLALKHSIHLITNYETTWYPTNHKAFDLINQDTIIGDVRKIIVRDGHKGPKNVGVSDEFLEWLTDPKLNGGGATIDFGCYGANLVTKIMNEKRPKSVTAITAQQQPENNPKLEDESIIILKYDTTVAIIQGSWNWPIARKDMDVYGEKGVVHIENRNNMSVRIATGIDTFHEDKIELKERKSPYNDCFTYFSSLIKGDIQIQSSDLSSLDNNLIVMEILDAAVKSSQTGKTICLKN